MLPTETDVVRRRLSAVCFGPFTFDRESRLLRSPDQEVPLPPRVVGLLELLIARAGEIVPRQELIDSIWKDAFVTDTSLAEAISFLRQALGDDPQAPTYIQTVHRRGYRFVAPIAEAVTTPLPPPQPPTVNRIEPMTASPSIGRELVPWSVALLCAVLAAAAVWQDTHLRAPLPPVVRMTVEPEPGTTFDRRAPALALSPDGTVAAWSACDTVCRLYVRPVDQLTGRAIQGTEDASAPFFSPDGRWVGFFGEGKLRKVALAGGLPIALAGAPQPFGAVWMDDQRIVFASSLRGGLFRVSDRGGEAEPVTQPSVDAGEIGHLWPALAPGRRALLFIVATSPIEGAPGRVAVMDGARPHPAWQTIVDAADLARAVSPDYIAFSRGNELHAAPFDRTRLIIAGPDQALATGVARAQFAVSASGALIYAVSEPASRSMTWVQPSPRVELPPELAALHGATLSPDGTRVAGVSEDQASADVWVGDVARGAMTRLTHGGINVAPVWGNTASGPTVFYAASRRGRFRIWSRDAAAALPEIEVPAANRRNDRQVFPSSFARVTHAPPGLPPLDVLAYGAAGGTTRGDIVVVSLLDGAELVRVDTPSDETEGRLSPDGRFLAYQSDESGRCEIYLLRIAEKRRTAVSIAGGTDPEWTPDGRTLLYRTSGGLVSVSIDATGDRIGSPVDVMPSGWSLVGVNPSGVMLVRRDPEQAPRHAVLTLEWIREVRGLLGPPNATLPR
ncbi:MAG: winged helix-turn-helix domain-containing protein [Acidobacteriota bacterium]